MHSIILQIIFKQVVRSAKYIENNLHYLTNNLKNDKLVIRISNNNKEKRMDNKESKREKFVRIAEARTNKIINMIQLLGNCSNLGQYEYTQKDVNKIFSAIQAELDEAKKRYSKQESQKGAKFTLD